MLTLPHVYLLIGALFAGSAILNAIDRRWLQAAFWAIVSAPCLFGEAILAANKAGTAWPAQAMGAGVIVLAVLAALLRPRPVVEDAARPPCARRPPRGCATSCSSRS